MIEAFRTIEIQVDLKGEVLTIPVPFTVELLHRVEETAKKTTGRVWFVLERSDRSIVEAFEEFCRPYFPADFDWSAVQPTFAALFFSRLKSELLASIDACMTSTEATSGSDGPMAAKTREDAASPSRTASS